MTITAFRERQNKRNAITRLFADCLFTYPFNIMSYLGNHEENLKIITDFLREFYISFKIQGTREENESKCPNGHECDNLYIHAVLETLRAKRYDDTTDNIPLSTNCHGYHSELSVEGVFADIKRQFEHPFYTKEMCAIVIDTLLHSMMVFRRSNMCLIEVVYLYTGAEMELKRFEIPIFNLPPRREREFSPDPEPQLCSVSTPRIPDFRL